MKRLAPTFWKYDPTLQSSMRFDQMHKTGTMKSLRKLARRWGPPGLPQADQDVFLNAAGTARADNAFRQFCHDQSIYYFRLWLSSVAVTCVYLLQKWSNLTLYSFQGSFVVHSYLGTKNSVRFLGPYSTKRGTNIPGNSVRALEWL